MAIRITTCPSNDNLYAQSHWWGSPDLPEGVDFPCSDDLGLDEQGAEATLLFLGQIRLEDIAKYDTECRLPHCGMLYFFADIDYFLGDDDAECEGLVFVCPSASIIMSLCSDPRILAASKPAPNSTPLTAGMENKR